MLPYFEYITELLKLKSEVLLIKDRISEPDSLELKFAKIQLIEIIKKLKLLYIEINKPINYSYLESKITEVNNFLDASKSLNNHQIVDFLLSNLNQIISFINNLVDEDTISKIEVLLEKNFHNYLNVKGNEIEETIIQYNKQAEILIGKEKEFATKLEKVDSLTNNFEAAFNKLENYNKELAILQSVNDFSKQATNNNKIAKRYLIASIIIGVLILGYIMTLMNSTNANKNELLNLVNHNIESFNYGYDLKQDFIINTLDKVNNITIIKYFALNITLISFMLYALRFTVKNYKINKHNYTINTLRAQTNSIAFTVGGNLQSDEVKMNFWNKVLDSIFSSKNTGYEKPEPQESNSGTIVKTILENSPLK